MKTQYFNTIILETDLYVKFHITLFLEAFVMSTPVQSWRDFWNDYFDGKQPQSPKPVSPEMPKVPPVSWREFLSADPRRMEQVQRIQEERRQQEQEMQRIQQEQWQWMQQQEAAWRQHAEMEWRRQQEEYLKYRVRTRPVSLRLPVPPESISIQTLRDEFQRLESKEREDREFGFRDLIKEAGGWGKYVYIYTRDRYFYSEALDYIRKMFQDKLNKEQRNEEFKLFLHSWNKTMKRPYVKRSATNFQHLF